MKRHCPLLLSLIFATINLSAKDYIQVKELMAKKEIQTTVCFSELSEFLNDYVVGTALTIEKKEGQFAGVAMTTHFDGFVEMGEGKFSPLVSGSKKTFTVPLDGSWIAVKISDDTTYTIRLIQE